MRGICWRESEEHVSVLASLRWRTGRLVWHYLFYSAVFVVMLLVLYAVPNVKVHERYLIERS